MFTFMKFTIKSPTDQVKSRIVTIMKMYEEVFLRENTKQIKFAQESREFVYGEGELVECLMQPAPTHLKLPTLYALCRA